jgi:tetratricopeptide (TPR) repeat protein
MKQKLDDPYFQQPATDVNLKRKLIQSLWKESKSIFPSIVLDDLLKALKAIYVVETKMTGRHCGYLGDKIAQYLSIIHFAKTTSEKFIYNIEIGTLFGGSCLMKLLAMRDFGVDGQVICIDPMSGYYAQTCDPNTGLSVNADTFFNNLKLFNLPEHQVDLRQYNSSDPRAFNGLSEKQFSTVMIDGDHSFKGVKHDFNKYSKFVAENGLLLIDDYAEPAWPDITLFVEKLRKVRPRQWTELGIFGTTLLLGRSSSQDLLLHDELNPDQIELEFSNYNDDEINSELFHQFVSNNSLKSRKQRLPIKLGMLYFANGRLKDSEDKFKEALASSELLEKEKFDSWAGLGKNLLKQKKIELAEEAFKKCIRVDDPTIGPDEKLEVILQLGLCYSKQGKDESAELIYKEGMKLSNLSELNKFKLLSRIGDFHFKKKKISEAQKYYSNALTLNNIPQNDSKNVSTAFKKSSRFLKIARIWRSIVH